MSKVYFLFGVHNHQPVGNDPYVFREAFENCYSPFLNVLKEFSEIKCNIHISGPLYDWALENKPDYIKNLKEMSDKGQVEIVGGAYYEPILQTISDSDKLAQIRLMNDFIKKEFGLKSKGMWLAERIWEPYLAKIVNEAGLKYTFLDDTHFQRAGAKGENFTGYYFTEESSKPIAIFPISKTLRYKIPFSKPKEAIAILKKFGKKKEDALVTLFDDGEKFGLWPTTYDWIYKKNWLRDFFGLLAKNEKYIETITASEALKKLSSNGLIYIPNSSYIEMDEWVMEPEDFCLYKALKDSLKERPDYGLIRHFITAGFFRNFFLKYSRLNYMHKRMLGLSERINKIASPEKDPDIFRHLWKSQCNCGYWHGVFGGFYFGHIRAAIYENLIEAEKKYDERYADKPLTVERADIDLDGIKETMIKNRKMIAYFSDKGAAMTELSFKDKSFNLANTITRRKETYHGKIGGRAKRDLVYDKHERVCFVDHLVEKKITLKDVLKQRKLRTLSNNVYELSLDEKENAVSLNYFHKENELNFSKKITAEGEAKIEADYDFSGAKLLKKFNFAVEFNLFIQSAKDANIQVKNKIFKAEDLIDLKNVSRVLIEDNFKGIKISLELDEADAFILPIYSMTNSIEGKKQCVEKMFQEVSAIFIKKNKKSSFKLKMIIDNL